MCRERWPAVAAALLFVSLGTAPRAAQAQACCAATGLVIPARLRVYEDVGVGLQARLRPSYGTFAADGAFSRVSSGDLVTEQDLFVVWRALERLQVGVVLLYVETWRRVPDRSEWGGFFGEAAADVRVEIVRPGDHGRFPSITLLGGVSLPTGRAPDEAHNPLGTDAAGSGSYQITEGLEVETLGTRWFASLDGWVTERSSRAAPGGRQSFAPRLTLLLAGGRSFSDRLAAAAFGSVTRGGGGSEPAAAASGAPVDTRVALATAGVAGVLSVDAHWRVQASLAFDLPLSGWGRNQPATAGLSASVIRVWP